ncbi:hypothetical protein FRB94_009237 [Tulasnella sp. JGI-2019a]|nr:hypothetical protein FRB94_009237 [Tulasnella sp. JGI-2019a]KAG9016494.1 hypothetical protein FRB93_010743 [Tulasnella sp. JGI-2019a]KAG9030563.1 hypothetical protein FRB95_003824 [Tulasnella sp. JGI-2019a]
MVRQSAVSNQKNIWVAAGDGDLERVKELIEEEGLSPNVPDPNTYTPMHAAASYAHIGMIDYLISRGGDVNVTDDDGETPLFVVESIATARHLVENGATPDHRNHEGLTPAENLDEDFPEVATYLRGLTSQSEVPLPMASLPPAPSQFLAERTTEHLSSELVTQVQEIMERSERDGTDPDEELRRVVGDTLLESYQAGRQMRGAVQDIEPTAKRARTDGLDL